MVAAGNVLQLQSGCGHVGERWKGSNTIPKCDEQTDGRMDRQTCGLGGVSMRLTSDGRVATQYRSVTDGQTDGRTDGQTCGLAALWMVVTQYRSVTNREMDGRTDELDAVWMAAAQCRSVTDGQTDGRTGCRLDGSGTIVDRQTDEVAALWMRCSLSAAAWLLTMQMCRSSRCSCRK